MNKLTIDNLRKILFMTALTALFLAVSVQFSSSVLAFNVHPQTVISEQQNNTISGEVKGFVFRNGEKIPAVNVVPGEEILWEMTLTNTSARAVRNISFDGDIPQGTVYVTNSASGVDFSLDGKSFSRTPMVRDQSGSLTPAPVSAYRAIRFTVSLQGSETKTLTYKTTVK